MPQLPQSVNQQARSTFQNECNPQTANGPEPVAMGIPQFFLDVTGKCREVADRNHFGTGENGVGNNSGGSCCPGPKFMYGLSTRHGKLPLEGMPGDAFDPSGPTALADEVILPLLAKEVCDLYHLLSKRSYVNVCGKQGTKVLISRLAE